MLAVMAAGRKECEIYLYSSLLLTPEVAIK
jgi:hypothetical protein